MAQLVSDGSVSFRGGQDDGLLPDRIREDQYRRGINVTTRGGGLRPRPGFIHQQLRMITQGTVGRMTYEQVFRKGKFQAATSYDTDSGSFIVAVISGLLFRIDPRQLTVEVLPFEVDGDRMNQYRRRIAWSHAGRFLVFFDWPNLPVIVDGVSARRSNPDRLTTLGTPLPEVPTSVLGAFVQNRLFVSNEGHEFGAGDPIGGINEDAPITFEESLVPAAAFNGQFFSLGSQSTNQPITAMGFIQLADTSTGYGPLFVATRNSIYTYQANIPRTQWENSQFGTLLLYNAGIVGERAFTNLNSDLVFLSGDGAIRTINTSRQNQQQWGNAPISREIEPFLRLPRSSLENLELAVLATFNSRVFATVSPYSTHALDLDGDKILDFAHEGMVVLELDNVATLTSQATPAWAGLWTGINPMEIVTLGDAPYIFSKDAGAVNRLYRMDENESQDELDGQKRNIVSRIYTKEYDFQSRFTDKKELGIDYTVTNISEDFQMKVERKSSSGVKWGLWKEFNHCAKTSIKEGPCGEMPVLQPHSFRELDFGSPDEMLCDPITDNLEQVVRKTSLRITLSAKSWRLEDIVLRYEVVPEGGQGNALCANSQFKDTVSLGCCDTEGDWSLYKVSPTADGDLR